MEVNLVLIKANTKLNKESYFYLNGTVLPEYIFQIIVSVLNFQQIIVLTSRIETNFSFRLQIINLSVKNRKCTYNNC